jgi:hypothetical protein
MLWDDVVLRWEPGDVELPPLAHGAGEWEQIKLAYYCSKCYWGERVVAQFSMTDAFSFSPCVF